MATQRVAVITGLGAVCGFGGGAQALFAALCAGRRAVQRVEALEAAGERGAVQLDGEMLDEASRKGAEQLLARGKAAGLGATEA